MHILEWFSLLMLFGLLAWAIFLLYAEGEE